MDKEQLQLTVSKEKSGKYNILFNKGSERVELANCTKDELRMIKEVICKVV